MEQTFTIENGTIMLIKSTSSISLQISYSNFQLSNIFALPAYLHQLILYQ